MKLSNFKSNLSIYSPGPLTWDAKHTKLIDRTSDKNNPKQCCFPNLLPFSFTFFLPAIATSCTPPQTKALVFMFEIKKKFK